MNMKSVIFILKSIYFFKIIFLVKFCPKISLFLIAKMGSFYIKLGQFLSTREDLVGIFRALKLKDLQHMISFDEKFDITSVFSKELMSDFKEIDKKPIKSASIAQVHKATLKNGDIVAIKVVKKKEKINLEKGCDNFLNFCTFLSKIKYLKRFNFKNAAIDIINSLLSELDMRIEARNINKFRYFFADDDKISAPFVYDQYLTKDVIVMEYINGKTILDIILDETFNQKKKSEIAKLILDSHIKQVYIDNFFHSDPHQSNLIYSDDERIFFIDFGGYSNLLKKDSVALLKIMNAFLNKDYIGVAKIHKEVGYINSEVDLKEFEMACKNIGDKYLNKTNFLISDVFKSLLNTGRRFKMELQPQLVMVQKTMVMIEGLVKSLDFDANPLLMSQFMINRAYKKMVIGNFIKKIITKINFFK